MDQSPRTWLILNCKSGSHTQGLERELQSLLAEAGSPVSRTFDCSSEELPEIARLDAARVGRLVVHGGDGTLNSVIRSLDGWDGEVLPLPGGTANLLCNRLFDDVETPAIIAALGRGALGPVALDCIKGRDWIALSEILGGPGALWADVREEMRDWDVADTITKSMEAITTSRDGPLVRAFAAGREIGRERGYAGVRLSPGNEGMTVQAYRIESLSEFVAQGAAILGHDFRTGPHDVLGCEAEVVLRSTENAPIELMIDGERFDGGGEETFVLAPLGVALLGKPE
ncbi:acylglycerol kinase family protein [Erythrobacteraceae bacterium WH01K]|nr:acylglycerol kinase family protein [Erythrobacteraceae bacterium WH01K]